MMPNAAPATWFVAAMLLCVPIPAVADDAAAIRRIEQAVERARKDFFVPGASIAVVKDGKIILLKGFGYRDVAKKLPATPDTVFGIGSTTKAFTGLLVAQTAREGKLSLGDAPSKYVPGFHLKDPDANAHITVLDLLCHRSGLPRTDLAWYSGRMDREEMLQVLGNAEPTAKLRQRWQYQNGMFMVAGMVAAAANGKTYEDLIRDRFFKPLGMTSSSVSYDGIMAAKERAVGYAPDGPNTSSRPLKIRNVDVVAPAGAINSTARDMAQWLKLLLDDGSGLFSKDAIADTRVHRIDVVPGGEISYGFGWMMHKVRDAELIEHGGNIDGYNAYVGFIPAKHFGVVMLTNVTQGPLATKAMDIVIDEFLPEKAATPSSGKTAAFVEARDAALGDYELTLLKLNLAFVREKGRLILVQGPAKVPMKLIADQEYAPDLKGAPDFKITFQPTKADPAKTEILLEQSGMKFTLTRTAPYHAPMSGEELLAKMVAATGSREATLAIRNTVSRFSADFLSDSITMDGFSYAADGNKHGEFGVMFCLNKRIGTIHDYTDGKTAGQTVSFTQTEEKHGAALWDSINAANLMADFEPKLTYRSLRILKEDKVGDEPVYVLERQFRRGSTMTDYVSTKSFRVLRRLANGTTTDYSDFRTVNGITQPFCQTMTPAEGGKRVIHILSITPNGHIPAWAFHE